MKKWWLRLYLIALFLVRIPPVYLFFFWQTPLLTTHTIARGIILTVFVSWGWWLWRRGERGIPALKEEQKRFVWLYLIYLGLQSFSVFGVVNEVAFLQRYKDIVFPGITLLLLLGLRPKEMLIVKVLVWSYVVNVIYQLSGLLMPVIFERVGKMFIYDKHFEIVMINLQRGRLFVEGYDEMILPIFLWLGLRAKKWREKAVSGVAVGVLAILSFLSNFRTRVVMLMVAVLGVMVVYGRQKKKELGVVLIVLMLAGGGAEIISRQFFDFSFVDRFLMVDKQEDVSTVDFRVESLGRAQELGMAYPLTGVGLGNYYDYLTGSKGHLSILDWKNKEAEIASTNPHNILAQTFAETGVLSLLFYLGMLGYFAWYDFKIIYKKNTEELKKVWIIAFWTLVSFSMFNPTTVMAYNILFWMMRWMIIQ